MNIGIIIVTLALLFSARAPIRQIDSLERALGRTGNDSAKAALYLQLFSLQEDTAAALRYLDSAYQLSRSTGSTYGQINALNVKSRYLLKLGRSHQALRTLLKVLSTDESERDLPLLATTYGNIGLAYYELGDADVAIRWHLKAVAAAQTPTDSARAYNNLGICYQKIKDWNRALRYHQRSLAICQQEGIEAGIAHNLGNLGIIQHNVGQFDASIRSHRRSLALHQVLEDEYHEAINYNNLGDVYTSVDNIDSALYCHQRALRIRERRGDQVGISSSLNNIAALQMAQEQYLASVEEKLIRARDIAQSIRAKDLLRDTYLNLTKFYEKTGNLPVALESRKQYDRWKDSTVSENHLNRIAELEMQYERQKQENEILALSRKNLASQVMLDEKNWLVKSLLAGIGTLLVLAALLFIIYHQRVSNERQRTTWQAIAETQEKERIRIARDLHDSVGIMLTAIKHQLEQGAAHRQLTHLIDDATSEVRRISHNMMPGALLKYGLTSAVEQLLSDVEQAQELATSLYVYGMEERLEINLEINIYRILQELVQNTVKHAAARHLTLHINRHKKYLNIILEDDGQGHRDAVYTDGAIVSEGVGLENIRSRVATWNGSFRIESVDTTGTTVLIDIPLSS